jgi:hypothetical protein
MIKSVYYHTRTQIGMFRPIRMDHTNCLQVAIKIHSSNFMVYSREQMSEKLFMTVVTLRFRRWQPFLVSLMCFGGPPPEAVFLCEVLRCIRGGDGRRVSVVYYLVVLGLLFWPFSGSGGLLMLGMGVAPSGRLWGVWGLGGAV